MRVKVIPFDRDEAIDKLYTACRTCYSINSPIEIYDNTATVSHTDKLKLLKHVLDSQHHSVLEHVSVTILIEGVSRSLTHQLVRHRVASYSQKSQRYVEYKGGTFDYVTPNTISKDPEATRLFDGVMIALGDAYNRLTEIGIPAEDARAILPNACCTDITMTVNLRELIHICNERLCTCAQDEIRALFREIAKQVSGTLEFMKPYLQPKCERDGYCSENKRRSCGRKPLRGEIINGGCNRLSGEKAESTGETQS